MENNTNQTLIHNLVQEFAKLSSAPNKLNRLSMLSESVTHMDGIEVRGHVTNDDVIQYIQYPPECFDIRFEVQGSAIRCVRERLSKPVSLVNEGFNQNLDSASRALHAAFSMRHDPIRNFNPVVACSQLFKTIRHLVEPVLEEFSLGELTEKEERQTFKRIRKLIAEKPLHQREYESFFCTAFIADFNELSDENRDQFCGDCFIEICSVQTQYARRILAQIGMFMKACFHDFDDAVSTMKLVSHYEVPEKYRHLVTKWNAPNNLNGFLEVGAFATDDWEDQVESFIAQERKEQLIAVDDELGLCADQLRFIESATNDHRWRSLRETADQKIERLKKAWQLIRQGKTLCEKQVEYALYF